MVTPWGDPQTFKLVAIGKTTLAGQDRKDVLKFQMKVGELLRAVTGANGKVQEALDQLAQIKKAVRQTPKASTSHFEEARSLELKLMALRESLTGDTTRTQRSQTAPPSIMRRVENALAGTLNNSYGPTQTHRREYVIGQEQYEDVVGKLRALIEVDFKKLKQKLDKAGVPWTPGRRIPEIKK